MIKSNLGERGFVWGNSFIGIQFIIGQGEDVVIVEGLDLGVRSQVVIFYLFLESRDIE